MPTLEERVAYLEGRLGYRSAARDKLRPTYREARTDSSPQFADWRASAEQFRTELRREFRSLGEKLDTHFRWLMALQVTTILAIGSAVVGLYFK